MATRKTRQLPLDQRRAIGARIVERRQAKRWNQRELARRAGMGQLLRVLVAGFKATQTERSMAHAGS